MKQEVVSEEEYNEQLVVDSHVILTPSAASTVSTPVTGGTVIRRMGTIQTTPSTTIGNSPAFVQVSSSQILTPTSDQH